MTVKRSDTQFYTILSNSDGELESNIVYIYGGEYSLHVSASVGASVKLMVEGPDGVFRDLYHGVSDIVSISDGSRTMTGISLEPCGIKAVVTGANPTGITVLLIGVG